MILLAVLFSRTHGLPGYPRTIDCDVEFGHLVDFDVPYQCPRGCDSERVIGDGTRYSAFSSVCASAIHGGLHNRLGGLLWAETSPETSSYEPLLSNAIWSVAGETGPVFGMRPMATAEDDNWNCVDEIAPLEPVNVTASSYLEYFTETTGGESVSTLLNWTPNQAVSVSSHSPWAPAIGDVNPWIELDLGFGHTLTKIVTFSSRVRYFDFRTKSFTVDFFDGEEWNLVRDEINHDQPKVFPALGQPSIHYFIRPITATKLRIYPIASADSPIPALKIILNGCQSQPKTQVKDDDSSMVMIGIIAGLSLIALVLATLSLLMVKKSRRKSVESLFLERTTSPIKNVYSHDPRLTEFSYSPCFSAAPVYSTPIVRTSVSPSEHQYSTIGTLPSKSNYTRYSPPQEVQAQPSFNASYDDHTYSTIG